MYEQKPTSSLMEDLEVLGLLAENGKKRRLSEADADAMAPDAAAAGHQEPDGDEAPGSVGASAPKAAPPMFPSHGAKVADAPKGDQTDKVGQSAFAPSGGNDKDDDKDNDKDDDKNNGDNGESDDDEDMAAYESAWDCVKQYYTLSEANEKLSEDDYKTVINAMAYIIETQSKVMDTNPNELPGGTDPKWAGDPEHDPNEKVQGTNAMRKLKGWKYHDGSPRAGEKAESLDALVGELKSLTQKTESDDEMQELGTKIIEGFEAIRDTAAEVAHGIAGELRESDEKVSESHPRVRLGKYFEGVSNDAKLLLRAISERETTDVDDAIEDLNSLARDLKRGLSQL